MAKIKTKSKNQKRSNEKPFNFYGIRKTRNPKYMSVTLVREDEDGERQWINVPVNIKNVKVKDEYALLRLRLLYDEDEDEDEDEPKSKSKPNLKESDEDLPFQRY